MSDLIDRQAVIDALLSVTGNSSVRELYEHVQEHGLSDMWSGGVNAAIDVIIAQPSIQSELIRCKDCRYYYKDIGAYQNIECQCDNWYTGTLTGDLIGVSVEPYDDFFCGFVERREDESD